MKFVCFKSESAEKRTSREIERKLAKWYNDDKKAIKLLLLGTGEAGKTTIIKQMKILHIKGFSDSERQEKVKDIRDNVHEAVYSMVTHMGLLDPPIELDSAQSERCARHVQHIGPDPPDTYDKVYFDAVGKLWFDSGIRYCYHRSNEYQLIDSTKYFLDRIQAIGDESYVPTDEDILHCRKKTVSIQKVEFSVRVPKRYGGGCKEFHMYDVGGQRGYRRKWIQVFEGIEAILFLVASSDFDQTLREDRDVNRLQESLTVFEDVWNSRFLQDSGVILFLNKQDVLREKVESGKSIGNYFSAYNTYQSSTKGGNPKDEYLRTKCFIRDLFLAVSKRKRTRDTVIPNMSEDNTTRDLYHHFTTATDTGNIRTVFEDVHHIVIGHNLEAAGIN